MLCENNNRVYKYQYLLHLWIRLGHLEIHIHFFQISISTSEPSFKVIVLTSLAYLYFKRDIEQGGTHKALLIKQEIAWLRGSSSTWFQTSCYRRAELNSKIMNTLLYYYFVRSGTIHSPSIRNQSSKSKVLSTQVY